MTAITAEIVTHANTLARSLVIAKRHDGTDFIKASCNAPDWVLDILQAAHGDCMPDDWTYEKVRAVAADMADVDPDDGVEISDFAFESAESNADIYTHDLIAWLAGDIGRLSVCDEAIEEYGMVVETTEQRIAIGQQYVLSNLANVIYNELEKVADEVDMEDEGA